MTLIWISNHWSSLTFFLANNSLSLSLSLSLFFEKIKRKAEISGFALPSPNPLYWQHKIVQREEGRRQGLELWLSRTSGVTCGWRDGLSTSSGNDLHWLPADLPTQLHVLDPCEPGLKVWYFVPSYWTFCQRAALSLPSLFGATPLIVLILWAACHGLWALLSNTDNFLWVSSQPPREV